MRWKAVAVSFVIIVALLLVACDQATGTRAPVVEATNPVPSATAAMPTPISPTPEVAPSATVPAATPAPPTPEATPSPTAAAPTPISSTPEGSPSAVAPAPTAAPPTPDLPPSPTATEMPDYVWWQLLDRDDIKPIYSPKFVSADEASYAEEELVMGVVINGEAKAYPVGLLNSREMVNDELGGIPILVTW